MEADGRARRQSAYHILVASSAERLQRDEGDLWDSGKIASPEQLGIRYAGLPLRPNQRCFWKVRVWDQDGKPSDWSAVGQWNTGLQQPEDWQAKWIGSPTPVAPDLTGCRWVWHPADGNAAESAPVGKRYFRKSLPLPTGVRIKAATLHATADNHLRVFVNGTLLGEVQQWQQLHRVDLSQALRAGENVIALEAENTLQGPAGLLGKLQVIFSDEKTLEIPVDASWKCASEAPAQWTSPGFDDRQWLSPKSLVAVGEAPWGTPSPAQQGLPLFRREFAVEKPVKHAVVHLCGLGHHDWFLNGSKVGDAFLATPWTVYEKSLHYSSHDVTKQLKQGTNTIGVMLGKGFYNTEGDRRVHGVHSNRPLKLILQAEIEYQDGTRQQVLSDGTWRTAPGPITHSAILGGEDFDARAIPEGWLESSYDDAHWQSATETQGPGGVLRAAISPPMQAFDVFKPVRIDEPQPGTFVYDFGQNASAIPRLRVRGKAGQSIKLSPAEQRHGSSDRRNDGRGLVNPAGVGHPNFWQYTLRGGSSELWSPQFNYSGFQYLQIEGAVPQGKPNPNGLPVIEELCSVHVRSAASPAGHFECAEPLWNAIDQNIAWAVRSNLSHVLTDCPHREKLGWLEVAYLMGPSLAGRYDLTGFVPKIAGDCRDSQRPDGMVPTVAPAFPNFGDNPFTYTPEWGAAAVILPWQAYRWYGDRRVLEDSYTTMHAYVQFMRHTATALVPKPGLGDWYDYTGKSPGASQFTPVELTAMATFYRCARIVAETAGLLGKSKDQVEFDQLAAQIREAFNAKFFNGNDAYQHQDSPQCANTIALALGLVPSGHEEAVLERVIDDLRKRNFQQTPGDVGFTYFIEALAKAGRHDVLAHILRRTDIGSYGFIIRNGWTAMPEAWDANTTSSMNHCMLGHIQQWFLGSLAGIQPDPIEPGFARFTIAPQPVSKLAWARGEYHSVRGLIRSSWQREAGTFRLSVTVPPNTLAEVHVPTPNANSVLESGKPIPAAPGVKLLRTTPSVAIFEVASGDYSFAAPMP